ncbi:DUF6544 family protein [Sorangium sp. So ce1000]|uniref:DUF6544 family protein n=1 Tax=Sorangium sp. So ce1000 TaxID=3133325 RepID=UPI003F5DDA1E
MRLGLALLIALHGAIHLIGYREWSKLAAAGELSARTVLPLSPTGSRIFALLWLTAMLALLAAAALYALRRDAWWALALFGVLLSQGLIVLAWPQAKFGTLVNVLLLLPIVSAAAHARFSREVDSEVRALLARPSEPHASSVEPSEIERLPAPVRTWLEASGVVGRERAQMVRLKQRGELRASPDSAWMPTEAEQYFAVDEPAFVWKVTTKMMGILPIEGRDKYVAGKGQMLIKAASLVDIVDAADEKIDQGAMLRFLGEIVWFPSAALSPYIAWEPIDATTAKATMRHAGKVASAVFTFDPQGRVVGLQAERYLGGGADAKLTPWSVSCSAWRTFRGIRIPSQGEVLWKLEGGSFSYYRWEILDVEHNPAGPYGRESGARTLADPGPSEPAPKNAQ